jgi:hypothetical protein
MSDDEPELINVVRTLPLFCSFCGRPFAVDYIVMEGRQAWAQRWRCLACHRHNHIVVAGLVVVTKVRD